MPFLHCVNFQGKLRFCNVFSWATGSRPPVPVRSGVPAGKARRGAVVAFLAVQHRPQAHQPIVVLKRDEGVADRRERAFSFKLSRHLEHRMGRG